MAQSVDELIEKAKEQRGRKRYEEALVSSLAAVGQDPDNGQAWWQVALCRQILGDTKNTIVALRKTVELIPDAGNAWARLGDLLLENEEFEDAREAFETALLLDPEQTTALEGMSSIYQNEDDEDQDEEEVSVLEKIERLSILSDVQSNRLGTLHYRNDRAYEAIRCWKLGEGERFNIGLAYNKEAISQDADAIDMWRLCLRDSPDWDRPKNRISTVLPRLLELALKARKSGETTLPEEQWFDHYMNPYQLLNASEDADLSELDPKAIQKLKKILIHEIDLEDGRVSWMPGTVINKSRAIGLCDELNDDQKKDWHWHIFTNKPLLDFLTIGAHEHFLVNENYSELETIDKIESDDDFLEWMGRIFVLQFDRVLTKAIEQGNAVLVECLLDGRRWVPDAMVDECFRSAQRAVERLANPLHEYLAKADSVRPSVSGLEAILKRGNFLEIMNLLPAFFEKQQNDAVHSVRGLAVKAFNVHEDIELSREIIELAKKFKFRSADANRTIEADVESIEVLIRQERKHEVKLTKGGERWEITKKGVLQGSRHIAAADITDTRWGALITNQNGVKVWDFLMAFKAVDGRSLVFNWTAKGSESEKSNEFFGQFIDAAMHYIYPSLIERTQARLASDIPIHIGPCKIDRHGIRFEVKGWIFSDEHFIPWHRVSVLMDNGDLTVSDKNSPRKRVSFSLRETNNAYLLKILATIKNRTED